MKTAKLFSIFAVAALLLAPATAMARTHVSLSLNLFDCVRPYFIPARPVIVVPAPPPPPAYYYYPVQPRVEQRTIVKEYHYYHQEPEEPVEEINSYPPYNPYYPQR